MNEPIEHSWYGTQNWFETPQLVLLPSLKNVSIHPFIYVYYIFVLSVFKE